ncbi:MAG: SDR family oxidoreductase [Proteobacteria bacterium]|nr:SDR family oxidoreductase [Pseudomonadota bacterium]MDA1022596.1 SDR family oxidoreductase [Pseudomonadota bacterium]
MKDDPLFDLQNRVFIIAGAGGGLGSAIARTLHERGAKLVLFDIDEARLLAVSAECPDALAIIADIRDEAALRAVVNDGIDKFERIDGAINAAGLLPIEPSMTADESVFRDCIDVNLTGAFLLSRVAAEALSHGGRIVHLASVSSLVANSNYAAYASSKAALSQLVRVLAREWAPKNITVNAIGPAMIETPMTEGYLSQPGFREQAVAVIPMGRLAEPRDLMGTIILLLAEGGGFITGQTIYVDGGRTLV